MSERNSEKHVHVEGTELEERLSAYYGPTLREQPLSQTAWHSLEQRLGPQLPQQRVNWKHLLRRRHRHFIPYYIQQSFEHVAFNARIAYKSSMLLCSFHERVREPVLRLPLLPRKQFSLLLPLSATDTMNQAELETLLATGLARSLFTSRSSYISGRIFFTIPIIVCSLLLLMLWVHWFIVFPIAILCYSISRLLLRMQKRKMVLACDRQAVQWLGRERICQGLHALADHSRTPYRSKWGEPSLAERIEHVCGTHVAVSDDSLTLVR